MSIGGSSDKKGSPNGETLIKKQTHTDKELAKMAGVGTGTIVRYNRVMNSNDEELKKKVLADEVLSKICKIFFFMAVCAYLFPFLLIGWQRFIAR